MLATIRDKLSQPKGNKILVLIIVCTALLLDNMLYMVVVPIIPDYLGKIEHWVTSVTVAPTVSDINVTEIIAEPIYVNGSVEYVTREFTEEITSTSKPKLKFLANTNEDLAVGVMFASKAILQLIVNPFSGYAIDRVGYDLPLMIGLTIMCISTVIFAFGKSYGTLFFARSLQGAGSAFADTSGFAMIADRFTEERERQKAMAVAIAFISFGCLVAPPFGGVLYQFVGKTAPFLILAFICVIDGALLYPVMKPPKFRQVSSEQQPKGTPIWRLFIDPYIAVCAGCLVMANVSLAILEPTIAIWMKRHLGSSDWQVGLVWLPAFIPHIVGVILTVKLADKYPHFQWLMAAVGLAIEGIFSLMLPFCKSYGTVIIPISGVCFGIAMVDTAVLPMLAFVVDTRHTPVYGSVYAIADISYSLAYAIFPIVAGSLVDAIGFTWLNIFIFVSNVGYAPLMLLIRNMRNHYTGFDDEADEQDGISAADPAAKYHTFEEIDPDKTNGYFMQALDGKEPNGNPPDDQTYVVEGKDYYQGY